MKKELKSKLYQEILKHKGAKDIYDICETIGIPDDVARTEVPFFLIEVAVTTMEKIQEISKVVLKRDEIVGIISEQISLFQAKVKTCLAAGDESNAIRYSKILTPLLERFAKLEGMNMAEKFQIDDERSIDLTIMDIEDIKTLQRIYNKYKKTDDGK